MNSNDQLVKSYVRIYMKLEMTFILKDTSVNNLLLYDDIIAYIRPFNFHHIAIAYSITLT